MFDGATLHLMVLVSVLPLVEFFDSFNSNVVVGIAFSLVILPSVSLIATKLVANKGKVKRFIGYCYFKCTHLNFSLRRYNEIPFDDTETPSNENETNIIDDSRRRRVHVTICDV